MKKLFSLFAVAVMVFAAGCNDEYDDSALSGRVDDLADRVEALEAQVKSINKSITGLQELVTALQSGDYITGITPITENGEVVGYTIAFAKGQPITIRNGADGKDGEDGTDGKDGTTPQIGVRQDTDGVYYWTLNGEWLTDASGNKVRAEGTSGEDGEDGADGVTPQLKIENGKWYVSIDGGASWTELGPAGGSATDSLFADVQDKGDYVYFLLSNGTEFSIPKHAALSLTIDAPEEVVFDYGMTKTFAVESEGVTSVTFTKPDEWKVSMADNVLTVTAPAEEHKDCAELQGEIAVIYFGGSNSSAVAKFAVKVDPEAFAGEPTVSPRIEMLDGGNHGFAQGSVVFDITVNPSSNAAHYYWSVGGTGLAGLDDEMLIQVLLTPGGGAYVDTPDKRVGPWSSGEEFLLLGVAVDASGNAGPLCKILDTAEIGKVIGGGDTPTPVGPTVSAEYEWVEGSTLGSTFAGYMVLYATLTTEGAHTYSASLGMDDLNTPEDQIVNYLLSGDSYISADPKGGVDVWFFDPGQEGVFVAVATDAEGHPGPLLREKVVAPTPQVSMEEYEKYLGTWTVSGLNKNGAPTSFEIEVEPNVAGYSYKVWGWTATEDRTYNAPVIWDFEGDKVVMKDRLSLGMDTYNNLPLIFVGFVTNGTQNTWVGNEGYPIAYMSLGEDGKTMNIEWNSFSSDDVTWTYYTVRYGLYQETPDGVAIAAYTSDSERYVVSNLKIAKFEEEELTDAYKAYLGNWTLTGRDPQTSSDVTFDVTISKKRANQTYTVTGWAGDVGTLYPCEMVFNAADGSVSLHAQSNLGTFTSKANGAGTVFTAGMIFDTRDFKYYFVNGGGEILRGAISGNSLTLTGVPVTLSDNTTYTYVGYRYFCQFDGGVGAFDGNVWPEFPATLVKSDAGARAKGRARVTASFEKAPQMRLSSVLNAANIYVSQDNKLEVSASSLSGLASRVQKMDKTRVVNLNGATAGKPVERRRELMIP